MVKQERRGREPLNILKPAKKESRQSCSSIVETFLASFIPQIKFSTKELITCIPHSFFFSKNFVA